MFYLNIIKQKYLSGWTNTMAIIILIVFYNIVNHMRFIVK